MALHKDRCPRGQVSSALRMIVCACVLDMDESMCRRTNTRNFGVRATNFDKSEMLDHCVVSSAETLAL